MIHNYEAQVTQLKACIFARQSVFRLARLLRDLLEQLPESKRDDFLYELMDDLELSAAAHYQDATCSKREAYVLMHGEEANWFWFFDQTQSCWDLNYPIGIIEEFKRLCDRLLSQYRYKEHSRKEHTGEILEHLEEQFSFLSKLVGSKGLCLFAFPCIGGPDDLMQCEVWKRPDGGGIMCETLILPDEEIEADLWVYESAFACLMLLQEKEGPSETDLVLLEQYWEPQIRSYDSEIQLDAYAQALKAGLAYQGPYGQKLFVGHSESQCAFWAAYIRQLIDTLGQNGEEVGTCAHP